MIPVFRGSPPFGRDLKVTAARSRIFSSTKLFVMASAAMAMSSLVPSTTLTQAAASAKPPVSPEGTSCA